MGCTGYSWREMLGHADEILVDNRSLIYMINTGGPELAPRRKPEWEYSISGSKNIPKFGFLKLQSFYDIKSEAKNMCDAEPGHPDPYDTSQQRPEARGGGGSIKAHPARQHQHFRTRWHFSVDEASGEFTMKVDIPKEIVNWISAYMIIIEVVAITLQ